MSASRKSHALLIVARPQRSTTSPKAAGQASKASSSQTAGLNAPACQVPDLWSLRRVLRWGLELGMYVLAQLFRALGAGRDPSFEQLTAVRVVIAKGHLC